MKKKIFILIFAFFASFFLSLTVIIYINNYGYFFIDVPYSTPKSLKITTIIKKIPLEKDWLFSATYENVQKQKVSFHFEPLRNIRCEKDTWKTDLEPFFPNNATVGCSFYMDYLNSDNKQVKLHWFLWSTNTNTYHLYDDESILSKEDALRIANSVNKNIVIVQDLTKI